tara:strand:- start:24 stop:230 length:207 start_codon:yes stop_codon:yes gene_type:complete
MISEKLKIKARHAEAIERAIEICEKAEYWVMMACSQISRFAIEEPCGHASENWADVVEELNERLGDLQ